MSTDAVDSSLQISEAEEKAPDVSAAEAAVELDRVGVRYYLPHEDIPSLKEYTIRRLQGRVTFRELWALRDVTFHVRRGEAFGIIGRNGAGKSTLLKVIARVLRPASGRVVVRGAIVPLLEVGAGFHPELTARENVYLNGMLLGRSRREIGARFDAIVDFAELWEFVDAPLRAFSSGMSVRLGFAVATAWEPDILLMDEVLAVGDEPFQRKCRALIAGFRQHGTTLLMVSHSAEAIQSMCSRALWLDHGMVRASGSPREVVSAYRAGVDPA